MTDAANLSVLRQWSSLEALLEHADAAQAPFVLLEQADDGHITVGPRFSPDARPCFRCYALRRVSHGARRISHARTVPEQAQRALERCVARLAQQDAHDAGLQLEIGPDGSVSEHVVLSVPSCRACRSRPAPTRKLSLLELVSPRVGLVRGVRDVAPGNALLPTVRADGARTDVFGMERAVAVGLAADVTRERAMERAVAEAVERYAAAFVQHELHVARLDELEGEVELPLNIRARLLARGSPALSWVRGQRLRTGAPVWLPAQCVYLPFGGYPGEPELEPLCSNGLAVHTSAERAAEHAMHELEERDVFVRAWRSGARPYSLASEPELLVPGMRVVRAPADDGPPVVVAMLESEYQPYCVWGAASRAEEAQASRSAQLEAIAGHAFYRERLGEGLPEPQQLPRTLAEHGLAHATRKELRSARRHWLAPRGAHPKVRSLRSTEEACMIELTPSDVAAAGLSVVRVILPGRVALDHDALDPFLPGNHVPHPLS